MEPILFLIMLIFTAVLIFNGIAHNRAEFVMFGFMMLFIFGTILYVEGLKSSTPEFIFVEKVGTDYNITFEDKQLNYDNDPTIMLFSLLFIAGGIIGTGGSAYFVLRLMKDEGKLKEEDGFSKW